MHWGRGEAAEGERTQCRIWQGAYGKKEDLRRIPPGEKRGVGTADCPAKHRVPVRCRAQREGIGHPEGRTKSLSKGCRKVRVTAQWLLPGPCFLAF